MSTPAARRLRLIVAAGVLVFAAVFLVPALTPDGSKEAFPAWRSVDGVPVADELPGSLVGVLRIARERTSENTRTSVVLGPGDRAACEPLRVTVGDAEPVDLAPDEQARRDDCPGLRLVTVTSLPGPISLELDGTTWRLDPTSRDPRSCQLGRDRTCAYWLMKGGRFGEPISKDARRVQAGTPETVLAVGDGLAAGAGASATRTVGNGDPAALLLCAAAAAPPCEFGLAARLR